MIYKWFISFQYIFLPKIFNIYFYIFVLDSSVFRFYKSKGRFIQDIDNYKILGFK